MQKVRLYLEVDVDIDGADVTDIESSIVRATRFSQVAGEVPLDLDHQPDAALYEAAVDAWTAEHN